MSRAWLFQDHRQLQKLGEDKCPWSVGWVDPDGKRKSKRIGSQSMATKYARKVEGQLAAGVYRSDSRKQWKDFRKEIESKILPSVEPSTQEATLQAVGHFERLLKPARVAAIKTQTVDEFIAKRRPERGRNAGSTVSPATINKELRHLKAVLRVAHDWGYLPSVPKIRMLREPEKIPRYVTPEHFAAIYGACNSAKLPAALPYSAEDWWHGVICFIYMTGWRISETLSMLRTDVDLKAGTALTRHGDNKGKRDDRIPLHSVIVEHLTGMTSFHATMFPWPDRRELLWIEFHAIQKAAGIKLACNEEHEHTDGCHYYGFHDLRRAFATVNAETMTADALQRLMRHKSYTTTQRYINMAGQLNRAVDRLHVPDVLRRKAGV